MSISLLEGSGCQDSRGLHRRDTRTDHERGGGVEQSEPRKHHQSLRGHTNGAVQDGLLLLLFTDSKSLMFILAAHRE